MTFLAPQRGIIRNGTLNPNAIRTIGYDMDYTLIHYRMKEWAIWSNEGVFI
jgi:5'-nucleotidase